MKPTPIHTRSMAAAAVLLLTLNTFAQTGREPLAVSSVDALPSLRTAMVRAGSADALERVIEAFDGQLMDRLNAGRKFEIVGRSDLPQLLREQELAASGNVATDDPNAARAGRLAGAKYLLVATLDDFEDATERLVLTNLSRVALKRTIRLNVTAKIYDSSTGTLMESASVLVEKQDSRMDDAALISRAERTDALLLQTAREAAERIANRVADAVFPVRVIVKRERQITVNRGEGGGMDIGQLWNVFAIGEELIDPDTQENLGREEVLVGKARIVSVLPKTSTAEILEDFGIERGAVLRRGVE
jgi:hypothetical protein